MSKIILSASALCENYRLLSALAKVPLYPVLKADAYGHGTAFALPPLLRAGAELFCVSSAYEALEIHEICKERITKPHVLIMNTVDGELLSRLAFLPVVLSVHSPRYARLLSQEIARYKAQLLLPESYRLPVHIRLDTGMHCLGLHTEAAIKTVLRLPHIIVTGVYSHLGCAEDPTRTEAQRKRFSALCVHLPTGVSSHLAASEGLFFHGCAEEDAVRVGLALYGVAPEGVSLPLRPVMQLSARVLSVFTVTRGTLVGYGSARAERRMRLAVLEAGYTDGIPPSAQNGGFVMLHGKKCPFFGAICMDRCTIEIGALPLSEGEEVTLFGAKAGDTRRFATAAGVTPDILLSLRSARTERILLP